MFKTKVSICLNISRKIAEISEISQNGPSAARDHLGPCVIPRCRTVGGQNIATFWQDHLVRGLTHKGENHETPRLENVAICCPPTAAIAIRAGSTSIDKSTVGGGEAAPHR